MNPVLTPAALGTVHAGNFSEFTYSKRKHFDLFEKVKPRLYKEKKDPLNCDLKYYQDLLVFSFLKENIPIGSRILEIGGGESRIINYFKASYECWNLDKLEGLGNGPTKIHVGRFRLIKDYIGNFNRELPDQYFDFVFSISVLEHVPESPEGLFRNILDDIERVLKPGGLSLHCIDVLVRPTYMWTRPFLPYIFQNQQTINPYIDFAHMSEDPDLYYMSETAYQRFWEPYTKIRYAEFGKPASYNVLWQKGDKLGSQ